MTPDIKNGPKLLEGLKKLNRSDPSVDVYVEGTGDIILNTCGQVHLEKCIVDLETIYCKVPIKTSDPIITFRETITWQTLVETKNQKYLQEIEKRRAELEKKQHREQFRAEKKADAELDE
jgi:ribosome assembly protein 1